MTQNKMTNSNKYPEYRMTKPISIWKPGNLVTSFSTNSLAKARLRFLLILSVRPIPKQMYHLKVRGINELGELEELYIFEDLEAINPIWTLVEL